MPGKKYYFNITDSFQTLVDRLGTELPSVIAARERASEHNRQVVNGLNLVVNVTDGDGATVLAVPLVMADSGKAGRDLLTGLAAIAEFLEHLARAVDAHDGGLPLGVLLLDIDLLKQTNDAFGRAAGDAVIRHVAALLVTLPRDEVFAVARLSGDKFGVLFRIADLRGAVRLAEEILSVLGAPMDHEGVLLSHPMSAGLAVFPQHADSAMDLVRDADIALHHAQAAGSGRLVVYSDLLRLQQQRRLGALVEARLALSQDRICPFYQPKVALGTGDVSGFEALLRVQTESGIRPPSTITDALDHPALAVAIGRRIQEKVFDDMQAWRSAGTVVGIIALNASVEELLTTSYADDLLDRLEHRGISPAFLQVEVTETAMIGQGANKVMGELQRLTSQGVGVFLDDFGTGYGSLTHLLEFSITGIKIDRSFISGSNNATARSIALLVIDIAKKLRLQLVAEGVETLEQANFLLSAGCDVMQGYLFAQAMPGEQVTQFLSDWRSKAALDRARVQKTVEQDAIV